MAATAVEAWDERWKMPEGRADWHVTTPSKLVVCRKYWIERPTPAQMALASRP